MRRPQLVIMLKEPRPGQVKTRLGREIGMTDAAWWFRHQSRRLIRRLQDPRWQLVLAVTPDRAGLASRVWPAHLPRRPQGNGNLGDRMTRLFQNAPPGPMIVIGADIPAVEKHHVVRAFRALGRHEAVLGPARDGGYWLIGFARRSALPAGMLRPVRWSSQHALADTLQSIAPLRIALVDTLADVDEAADLDPGSIAD